MTFSKRKFLSKHRNKKFGSTRTQKAFEATNGRCGYCKIKLLPPPKGNIKPSSKYLDSMFTLDHLIPLSKGGKSSQENLLSSCRKCNNKRGNSSINYLRFKMVAERDKWPIRFHAKHYEFLLSKGIDLSSLTRNPYVFYFEKLDKERKRNDQQRKSGDPK